MIKFLTIVLSCLVMSLGALFFKKLTTYKEIRMRIIISTVLIIIHVILVIVGIFYTLVLIVAPLGIAWGIRLYIDKKRLNKFNTSKEKEFNERKENEMNAVEVRNIFWQKFDEYVSLRGGEFTVCHVKAGKNQAAGNINTDNPMAMQTICCEFLYLRQEVIVQFYINNNVRLFDYLYSNKTKLEEEIGYDLEWITSGKKSDTVRRIQKAFPIYINTSYFDKIIPNIYDCVKDFIRVFEKYVGIK